MSTSVMSGWVTAARPRTLVVGLAPVIVGAACGALASGRLHLGPLVASLACVLALQIGTNFANDVFDFENGADNAARIGPTRAVLAGLLSPRAVKQGMIASFGVAVLLGAYLVAVGGPWILVAGIASVAAGIAYTGGPIPLGYRGLGDALVFVFFGPVGVLGASWVTTRSLPTASLFAAVGVGALATAVLVVNNTRDEVTDRASGKRTLVVRFGRRFGVLEYRALLVLAAVCAVAIGWVTRAPGAALGAGAVAIAAIAPLRVMRMTSDPHELGPALGQTARVLFVYAVVVTAGLAVSARSIHVAP